MGSFTFSSSSALSQTSSTEAVLAPFDWYCWSGNWLPAPAPVSTTTSWPRWTSSRAPAGVSATRYSSGLISFATPIFTGRATIPASARAEEQQERGDGLDVLELVEALLDVVDGPSDDLHVLAVVEFLLSAFEVLRDEEVHLLVEESGRREVCPETSPPAAAEPDLFLELALRRVERILPVVDLARRELDQFAPRRLARLPHEHDAAVVDRDDRRRPRMLDDFAITAVPALDDDAELLAVVSDARVGRLVHPASRSTSERSASVNHGGDPAAAFSRARSGRFVAGITRSTRGSESAHLRSACAHVSTPNSRRGSS